MIYFGRFRRVAASASIMIATVSESVLLNTFAADAIRCLGTLALALVPSSPKDKR